MHILGISCYYHDSAAALLRDGMLFAAAEEERFSPRKHDFGFPHRAIDLCLSEGGTQGPALDYVVFYEKPHEKFARILKTTLGKHPQAWRVFRESMIAWFNEKLWIKGQIVQTLNLPAEKGLFVERHLSDAASALFCSPYEEAAMLTIDGVGEWITAAIGSGRSNWNGAGSEINLTSEIRFPPSLGLLYSAFTAYLGFRVNEYKVMGMAPYGKSTYMDEVARGVRIHPDGSFRLNMDYISFTHSTKQTYRPRCLELFGPASEPESEFFTETSHPEHDHPDWDASRAEQDQRFADIAASIQRTTEEIILKMAVEACRRAGTWKLCMAGGVALNSVANGRILRDTPVKDLYIQAAAGDSGGALGAALYAYHVLLGHPRKYVLEHSYSGKAYSQEEIASLVDSLKGQARVERIDDEEALTDRVVDIILGSGL